jgi:antitoxin CptB
MLNAEILRDAEQRRFSWRCRRGLLELDIVLQDFVSKEYSSLNLNELQVFDEMLALPDNEFWDLINATKDLKKNQIKQLEIANVMLEKLRSVRPNYNTEAN